MSWLLRTFVDLFNALAAWYYRRKFGAAARQLGRLPHEEDGRRGFIIIEIDGLAHQYLRQALRQNAMPYLARLIRQRSLRLVRWRCGLPSTTPASQAGIMYGNNWDIPGFRWFEKVDGRSIMCKIPAAARAVQERISAGRVGLLRGGSSYTNMFDGDARLALFTLAAMGRDRLLEHVRGLGFLVLFGLGPVRLLKVILLSLWTWLVYVAKRAISLVVPSRSHFTFLGPLFEIFNNIIFREVTTFSTMVDIYRGMPAIYAAYTGYDEIAHHFGADSKEAFRALHGVDRQIRQIDRIRKRYKQREYDLYILSDHGMTPSVPFRRAYGQSLQEFIADQTDRQVQVEEAGLEDEGFPEARLQFILEEVRGLEQRPHGPLPTQVFRAARERLESRLAAETSMAEWDLTRQDDIIVRSSGSLSHVYFNVAAGQMALTDVVALYPKLLEALDKHEGVGLVVGREGEQVVVDGPRGTLWLGPDGSHLEGEDPLVGLSTREWAAQQIERLARFPHSGDLILFGTWDEDGVISFEDQVATHGGLGGPQTWPFLAYSSRDRLSARGIENAEEVYARLARIYGDDG